MAIKTHCDLCDSTPATDRGEKTVSYPGRHFSTRNQLTLTVVVSTQAKDVEDRDTKDVCDRCRANLVAEAFGLRTPEELYELRDQVTELTRQLDEYRRQHPETAIPMPVPAEPAGVVDPEIPF